jgi:hypothetical protein
MIFIIAVIGWAVCVGTAFKFCGMISKPWSRKLRFQMFLASLLGPIFLAVVGACLLSLLLDEKWDNCCADRWKAYWDKEVS